MNGHLSSQECRVRAKAPKKQKTSRPPRWHCERRLRCIRSIYRTRSSASQMTAARVMDVIARLLDCAGHAADAVPAHTQVKMEDAPRLLQIPVRMSRYMDTSSTTQLAKIMVRGRRPGGSSRTKFVRTPTCCPLVGKTIKRGFVRTWMGKIPNWKRMFVHQNKCCFCQYMWMTSN